MFVFAVDANIFTSCDSGGKSCCPKESPAHDITLDEENKSLLRSKPGLLSELHRFSRLAEKYEKFIC